MKKLFGIVASSRSTGYDPDALFYINAVETADQFVLETPIKDAYNNFIVGCKNDNLWIPIKASCILAGARTLSGALVPLTGPAPTSVNFVENRYSRTLGLLGNGATMYLNSNRNNNADPQDDNHNSVWLSNLASFVSVYMGCGINTDNGVNHLLQNTGVGFGTRNRSVNFFTTNILSTGFLGASRNNASNYDVRGSKTTSNIINNSSTPFNGNLLLFSRGTPASLNLVTDARISFYSIGEALDLEKLDNRVTTLMSDISSTTFFDSEAVDYVRRVEAADGQPLERPVQKAIIDFIEGCKADNIWSALKASCLMCGARTVAGALTPLAGVAPTNGNFIQADYDRKIGLKGDGISKYLNTNRNNNADPQDNNHNAVYVTEDMTGVGVSPRFYIGGPAVNITGNNTIRLSNTTGTNFHNRSSSATDSLILGEVGPGLKGHSRNNSSFFIARNNQVSSQDTRTSVPPANTIQYCFSRNDLSSTAFADCRMSFYSIGEYLDLEKLENRLATLHTTLAQVIA